MDFFENIDALLWRLAAILALVLVLVATLVVRLLLRDRGRSDRQQKLRVQQTLKGSGLAADKAPNGFTFGLLGGKKVYLPCDGEGHIAIFGGSGQGKTSALLIPSLRVWQGPFFCIDISGDISKNVPGEKKALLAPDDPEHSVIYNVFDEIDRASDPDERRGRRGGGPFFFFIQWSSSLSLFCPCRRRQPVPSATSRRRPGRSCWHLWWRFTTRALISAKL